MKNTIFLNLAIITILCMSATQTKAQLEVKVEPLGLIFNIPTLSAEFIANDKIGVEFMMGFKYGRNSTEFTFCPKLMQRGNSYRVLGKYYFNPKKTADRWHAGLYFGSKKNTFHCNREGSKSYTASSLNAGFTVGYKWHWKSGFLIETSSGIGRLFGDENFLFGNLDGFFKLSLGYRF